VQGARMAEKQEGGNCEERGTNGRAKARRPRVVSNHPWPSLCDSQLSVYDHAEADVERLAQFKQLGGHIPPE
jgi:hypothetical protein